MLTAVCAVIGLVSVLAMQRFLEDRLDAQLTSAVKRSGANTAQSQRSADPVTPPAYLRMPGPGPDFLFMGQQQGTLGVVIDTAGTVQRAGVLVDNSTQALTAAQRALLRTVPADKRPYTVDLGGSLGRYRVVAERVPGFGIRMTGLPLKPVHDAVIRLVLVITVVSALGLLIAAAATVLIIRLTLRPLRRVAATAAQVAELPLDRGEVALDARVPDRDTDARTEVGQVGAALNRMLEHVAGALSARQASEARVRRFVADASHELRTPLAAIRGYAELTRRSRAETPPDVAHALARVESESIRMTGLVDDLLLLARLDDGRPLEREPVDLSALVVDAVGDAHAAGPDHVWRLALPGAPVLVVGDEARLHQVLVNLLANARVHTPAATRVTVGLDHADDGRARLRVTDDGPGIPESLQGEVFERFARGDSSRARSTGSTGLGLSIVAAVVAAHGGEISVTSEPGRTEFCVLLEAFDGGPDDEPVPDLPDLPEMVSEAV
ncbi:sensor histidine kinase [Spongisporangium articulatum]